MVNIGVVVTERCQSSSVALIIDLLMASNYAARRYLGEEAPPLQYKLIGLEQFVTAYNGNRMGPISKIQRVKQPDIVIVPGVFESIIRAAHAEKLLDDISGIYPYIKKWHERGAVIAGVCTGNLVLTAAQITKGRPLTCHWASEDMINAVFPDQTLDIKQLLLDHGDVVSAGGAAAVSQLVLYLIARFHSRELANATGKLMLVEQNLDNQSRFAIFKPYADHGDQLVGNLQRQIEVNYAKDLNIARIASAAGIGARQLTRRFKTATGETPVSYKQKVRVEQVKIGLESSKTPINSLIYSVGYDDPASFRRLFKRLTGLSMIEYRNRFSSK